MRPDRPTVRSQSGVEHYQSNRVVKQLLTQSTLRGCADLSKLWEWVNNGAIPKEDMLEFYQLIGWPVVNYKEIFKEDLNSPPPPPPVEQP